MDHGKNCDHSNCIHANTSVNQTLSEMHWERGLWYAAFYGDEERVRSLIAKAGNAKEIVNTPDNSGYTPLHYAARKGYVDTCKILLQNGALIDAKTKSGQATPLLKAAAAGKIETIKLLIHFGACVDTQDADGQTALHKAVENKHFDLVNFLVETYPKLNTMKDNRAFYGDEERVRSLIAKAGNAKEIVNTPDNSGYTPLHYAARKGYVDTCKILLQNGALIDAKTKSGQATPLLKAAAAGKIETIKLLIHFGACVDTQDADGQTALHKAVENKHFDLVNFLVETYPKLNTMKDNRGHCPSDYMSCPKD